MPKSAHPLITSLAGLSPSSPSSPSSCYCSASSARSCQSFSATSTDRPATALTSPTTSSAQQICQTTATTTTWTMWRDHGAGKAFGRGDTTEYDRTRWHGPGSTIKASVEAAPPAISTDTATTPTTAWTFPTRREPKVDEERDHGITIERTMDNSNADNHHDT